jgi:formate-dependent nitrite reductase membrane component NrfD
MSHEWGLLIVLYLFLGGLSAGLLALSSAATLWGGPPVERIAKAGAACAPWPVLAGTALLVFDLGRPFYFWKLLVAFEPTSPMWLGTWLLTLFSLASVPYAATFLPAWIFGRGAARIDAWRRRLAAAGLPLALGVGIYTGVLLGVLVARPLWNTPLLAQLFLVSALSTASAFLLLLLRGAGTARERRLLAQADIALIVVELLIIGGMFLEAGTSAIGGDRVTTMLAGGLYGWMFWIGVVLVGLLVPLAFEVAELLDVAHTRRGAHLARALAAAPVLVLAGGLLLRWVFVYAGQVSRL